MPRLLISVDTQDPITFDGLQDQEVLVRLRDYFAAAVSGTDVQKMQECRVRTFAAAPKKPLFIIAYGGKSDPLSGDVGFNLGNGLYNVSITASDIPGIPDAFKLLQWVQAKCNDYAFVGTVAMSPRNIGFGTNRVAMVKFNSSSIPNNSTVTIMGQVFNFVTAPVGKQNEVIIDGDLSVTVRNFQNAINRCPAFIESVTAYSNSVDNGVGVYVVFTAWPPAFQSSVGGPTYTAAGGATVPPSRLFTSIGSVALTDWPDNDTFNLNSLESIGRTMAFVLEADISPMMLNYAFYTTVGSGQYFQKAEISGGDTQAGVLYNGDKGTASLFQYQPLSATFDLNEKVVRRNPPPLT